MRVNGENASLRVDVHDSKRFCLSYRIILYRYVRILYSTYRIFEILNNWPQLFKSRIALSTG